jgi:hypothetical protein
MKKKPKAPAEDPTTVLARARQMEELAELDEEENRRIKRMLIVGRGARAFRGNINSRTPNGTAGTGAASGRAGGIVRGGRGGGSGFRSIVPV